jgi:hypothetical protein
LKKMTTLQQVRPWLAFPVAMLLCFMQHFALAAAGIAYSEDSGYAFRQTNLDDIEVANKRALEGCSEKAQKCVLVLNPIYGPTTIAIARGDGGASFATSQDPKKAYDDSLRLCKKARNGCSVESIDWEPGAKWFAWAVGKDAQGIVTAQFLSYNTSSKRLAEETALAKCDAKLDANSKQKCEIFISHNQHVFYAGAAAGNSSGMATAETLIVAMASALDICRKKDASVAQKCKITDTFENHGPMPEPANFHQVYLMTDVGKKESRPAKVPTAR